MSKSILLFILLLIVCESKSQETTTFIFPPSLELTLDKKEWKTSHFSYDASVCSMTSEKGKIVNRSKDITIKMMSFPVGYMELKDLKYFNRYIFNQLTRTGIFYNQSQTCGFTLFSPDTTDWTKTMVYSAYNISSDNKYFSSLDIIIKGSSLKEAAIEVENILKNALILTPKEMDKRMGFPWDKSKGEKVFEERMEKYKKRVKSYYGYIPRKEQSIIDELTFDELVPEIKDQFTHERFFKIAEKVVDGSLSLKEVLDYDLLGSKSDDAIFYNTYRGNGFGKYTYYSYNKSNIVTQHFSELNNQELKYYSFAPSTLKNCTYDGGLFWGFIYNRKDSLMIYSLIRESDDWKANCTFFAVENERDGPSIRMDYSRVKENPCDNNTTGNFIILNYNRDNGRIVGLQSNPKSNFIIQSDIPKNHNEFDVMYDVSRVNEFKEYNETNIYRYGKQHRIASLKLDISDSIIYKAKINDRIIENYDTWDELFRNENYKNTIDTTKWMTRLFENDSQKGMNKKEHVSSDVSNYFIEEALTYAPAEKRLYAVTNLIHDDLDKDGFQEVYTFSVSNGKIIHANIIEETKTGVESVSLDGEFYNYLESTPLAKLLIQASLREKDFFLKKINAGNDYLTDYYKSRN